MSSEDMCSDSADDRSCRGSWASGSSIVEDPAVWTQMTNDSGTDGDLLTSEPQAGADLSLGSSVVSDCDGTLPRCELLVCTGQEFDGWEDVADTCDCVGLGDNCGTEGVHGVAETYPRVWYDSTSLKINNPPLTCSSEGSPASVPPARESHVCDGFTLQEECTATCAQSYGAKSSATALTTQVCHLDGFTNADTGLLLPICITTTLWQCSDSTAAQTEKFDALGCTNSTVG